MSISTVLFLLFAGLASLASADFDRASATPDESPWLDNLAGKPVAAHHTQQEDDYALASRLAGGFHESDYEPPFDDGEPSTITLNNSAFLSNFTARGGVRQIDFVAKHGRIYANGQLFDLKGVNWFGSESRVGPPGGLNHHTIGWYVDFLARHHFNAIRLLFNHESILADAVVEPSELLRAPELRGKTYLTMFQLLARAAAKRGILVMMACHRLHPAAWPGHGLWYDPEGPITEEVVLRSWCATRTASHERMAVRLPSKARGCCPYPSCRCVLSSACCRLPCTGCQQRHLPRPLSWIATRRGRSQCASGFANSPAPPTPCRILTGTRSPRRSATSGTSLLSTCRTSRMPRAGASARRRIGTSAPLASDSTSTRSAAAG